MYGNLSHPCYECMSAKQLPSPLSSVVERVTCKDQFDPGDDEVGCSIQPVGTRRLFPGLSMNSSEPYL
jgi:hypothetical protein